jgi:predicted ATPase/signal transduction histidine kinase/DNA-binding response OmpR family regulator/tRNA A-37 threonylcarbamoyl transferase component Bud32
MPTFKNMIALNGYQITEKVYSGANTVIYRGIWQKHNVPVIVKTLKSEYPTLEQITRLRHESKIRRHPDELKNVVKFYRIENYQNGIALILEDFGGVDLAQYLSTARLKIKDFLTIAVQLANGLAEIHQNQIIHKDIKPHNIIINPETEQVKITDFSIASRLGRENATSSYPKFLEGSLAYMSPEQTGRMNRVIDYRSDFYSLGVTFYEMLTGKLPFCAIDPLELVHCHIAKIPDSPRSLNPEIPEVVSGIVMKLLAKTAEDRYQSAEGLRFDLETCLAKLQASDSISDFTPGNADRARQLTIPQKLYGRNPELATLMSAFNRISGTHSASTAGVGGLEMILVSGYSGIGKSCLVNEVQKPIARQRGYFISGKFDQLKRNIPYSSLIQAFQSLMRQLLTESEISILSWKYKLLAALGTKGKVIAEMIPEVELIIGRQSPAPKLGALESQNRFNQVLKQFISVFATKDHPLVIFLDDLQWADSASLKLIDVLMSDSDNKYLLLIGAYRDNEVSATHPLIQTVEKIQAAGATVNNIILSPLQLNHVGELIADTLNEKNVVSELTELLFNKTQGNPFFLTQLLKTLYQEDLLVYDLQLGSWQWDIERIQAIGITDCNIVELIARNIRKLPEAVQLSLKLAACIGSQFNLEVLAVVSEKSLTETALNLWDALQAGLILPLSKDYKIPLAFEGEESRSIELQDVKVDYKFLHDKVQQAAYSLIPEALKRETHLKIGQLLLKNTSPRDRKDCIFALVNQLNFGIKAAAKNINLLAAESEKYELAELNLIAGQKAKSATAYEAALRYLKVGLALLKGESSWQNHYQLTFNLFLETAEAEYLNTNFERAETLTNIILRQAADRLDRVKVFELKIQIYAVQNQMLKALTTGLQALEMMGISRLKILDYNRQKITLPLLADLDNLPEMKSPEQLAIMRMLMSITSPALNVKSKTLRSIVVTQVNLCIEQGYSALAAFSYSWYGTILCGSIGDIDKGYQAGQIAVKLLDRFDANLIKCQVLNMFNGFIRPWKEHARETLEPLQEGFQSGMEVGDLIYAGFNALNRCIYTFLVGEKLDLLDRELEAYLDLFQKNRIMFLLPIFDIWKQVKINLQGLNVDKHCLMGEHFNEGPVLEKLQAQRQEDWTLFNFYLAKQIICYLFKDCEGAVASALLAKECLQSAGGSMMLAIHNFYESLALLAGCDNLPAGEKEKCLAKVNANQAKMHAWAHKAPMNYQHKYELVEAERARVLGEKYRAMDYYDRAIDRAAKQGYIQESALANELAAEFYLSQGREKVAKTYMTDAYYGYIHWGANAKVADLETRYPQSIVRTPEAGTLTKNDRSLAVTSVTSTTHQASFDFASVMKAFLAISGELVLDSLLEKLMVILLENAGAENGCLLAPKDGEFVVEAEVKVGIKVKVVRSLISLTDEVIPYPYPQAVINYVNRTWEDVVLNDASSEAMFNSDPYITQYQPKSLLCLPIVYQGKLNAILYLENNLTVCAFTPAHLEVLKILSSQAAIALENARLYANLETANQKLEEYNFNLEVKVEERTQQLHEKNALLFQEIKERQKAEAEAKAASLAKSEFLANMSHEFRTPLNGILGYTQILKRDKHLTAQQQDGIRVIQRCGEHLLELIGDILDISKIEARKMELAITEFDFPEFIHSINQIFRIRAAQKGIAFNCEFLSSLPQAIAADEKKLRQILINLIGNAVKFTETGGVTLKIFAQNCPPGGGETEVATAREMICFQIEDTGIGIADSELSRIFSPFEQVGNTRSHTEGTGLGLAISSQLVGMMGGELKVTSTLGRGSIFFFELELEQAKIEDNKKFHEKTIKGFSGNKKKLLVADDKWENRSVFVQLLAPLGFEIIEAADGQECVAKAQEFKPDCILMDLVMPVMDGFEAVRQIRKLPELQNVVAIGTSASILENQKQVSLTAGCNAFLTKPVRAEDLFDCLQIHLGLEWICEELQGENAELEISGMSVFSSPPAIDRQETIAPPPEEIEILFELAMMGDLGEIQKQAEKLEKMDVKYVTFARKLIQLAKDFDEQKILELVEQYRGK